VAINALWKDLAQDSGIFAINGPPGTGKTTLLRDVVAAISVERAKILARLGKDAFVAKRTIKIADYPHNYHSLSKELSGFTIVVASSNNGAVENLSLELPKETAIDQKWVGKTDIFTDLAGLLLDPKDRPAWAMIAGRLGNKSNRSDFVNTFWWTGWDGKGDILGLRARLIALREGAKPPTIPWEDAVSKFNMALQAEHLLRDKVGKISKYVETLAELADSIKQNCKLQVTRRPQLVSTEAKVETMAKCLYEKSECISALNSQLDRLQGTRPGILDWISTFGGSHREWQSNFHRIMEQLQPLEDAECELKREYSDWNRQKDYIKNELIMLSRQEKEMQANHTKIEQALLRDREWLGPYWPDLTAHVTEQEKSSPWAYPEWREARIKVFLSALELHKSFIENHSQQIMGNLGLAMSMLSNGISDRDACQTAFDSLTLVCPVISTTFASVSSLFGAIGGEGLGWLLIDEAGQATPQAAAATIWRSRRTVVVGDPLQLEPVVTIPGTVEASLAGWKGNVDKRLYPSVTSVQLLADQSTAIGTVVEMDADAQWVGAPLRVHRRCDDPMFTISNAIAYGGLMVHQKEPSDVPWPPSRWIHVPKCPGGGNHWLPAEGEALKTLLRDLTMTYRVSVNDIFLISPFRDVVKELRVIGREFKLNSLKVGTVHTTQGKEAEVVIMVLGGSNSGVRDWAAGKPNLLNVAISRAKTRFYVIGERPDWSARKYFDVLARDMTLELYK